MSSTARLNWGLVLSGVGHIVHNVQEFGVGILAAWETLLPVTITVALIGAVRRQIATGGLLAIGGWGLVVLIAGGGSVLPLPVLPFEPEQSTAHQLTHVAYALLQVPLLAATMMALAEQRGSRGRRLRPTAGGRRRTPRG